MKTKLIQAYEGAVALLMSLASTYNFTAELLPPADNNNAFGIDNKITYQYNEFVSVPDGKHVVLLGQRANLGVLSEKTMSILQQDLLGVFTRSSEKEFCCGRGFQYIDEPYWIHRNDHNNDSLSSSSSSSSPPGITTQNVTLLKETYDYLLISPIEVYGFIVPELPNVPLLTEYIRPAFEIISGKELVSTQFGWLTPSAYSGNNNNYEQGLVLFTTGYYAFAPITLRENPYPYGPGAFDLAYKNI